MNSKLIHDPWILDDDIFPSTYASLKDAVLAANVFDEIEDQVEAQMEINFPNDANCGPYLRAYMPMGREWERIALEIMAHIHAANIRTNGTVFIHGALYRTRKDGGGGAPSIEPEASDTKALHVGNGSTPDGIAVLMASLARSIVQAVLAGLNQPRAADPESLAKAEDAKERLSSVDRDIAKVINESPDGIKGANIAQRISKTEEYVRSRLQKNSILWVLGYRQRPGQREGYFSPNRSGV